MPVAGAICFVAGFLFGFPALKFGGLYLALATFALAVAAPQMLSYKGFDAWTGGAQGLQVAKLKPPAWAPVGTDAWTYSIALVTAVLLFGFAINLVGGRIGRALIAIRDHAIAAEAMGVNAALYKTTAFGLSALYAGVAGGLSAYVVGFISPESFTLPLSLRFSGRHRRRRSRFDRRGDLRGQRSSNMCRTMPISFRCSSGRARRRCRAPSTACC